MKPVKVTIDDPQLLERELRRKNATIRTAIAAEVQATAGMVVADARAHLNDAARLPVSRTGQLAASLHVVRSANGLVADIRTLLAYGSYLEFGTRTMPPYPWLGPAWLNNTRGLKQRIRAAIRSGLKGTRR